MINEWSPIKDSKFKCINLCKDIKLNFIKIVFTIKSMSLKQKSRITITCEIYGWVFVVNELG